MFEGEDNSEDHSIRGEEILYKFKQEENLATL
jgi:hypothetical protein